MSSDTKLPLRVALRAAAALSIPDKAIGSCLDLTSPADALFDRARRDGLASLSPAERHGLNRTTGEVAESVAEALLAEVGTRLLAHNHARYPRRGSALSLS